MKNRLFLVLLTGLIVFSLPACGKQAESMDESTPAEDEVVSTAENEENTEEGEAVSAAESFVPAEDVPSDGSGDDDLPDYLKIDAMDEIAISEDINAGEGVAALAGEVVTLKEGAKEKKIGETIPVQTAYGDYELTVDQIALTDERNANDTQRAPYVVMLQYHYKNTNYSDAFLLGEVSFKVLNDQDVMLSSYAFSDVPDEDFPQAEPIEKGETAEVTLGYLLTEKTTRIRVVFDDLTDENGVEYYWDVEV